MKYNPSMICSNCNVGVPTKYIILYQNIAAFHSREEKFISGHLCKSCINKYFWKYTLTTLLLGWWGLVGLMITPGYILNNIFRYIASLTLRFPKKLTEDDITKLLPFTNNIVKELNNEQKAEEIAKQISWEAGITYGKALFYIISVLKNISQQDLTHK